jgi:hypothetical protein
MEVMLYLCLEVMLDLYSGSLDYSMGIVPVMLEIGELSSSNLMLI